MSFLKMDFDSFSGAYLLWDEFGICFLQNMQCQREVIGL